MTFNRCWKRVICVGSGPSLDAAQAQRIARAQREDGWRVITVNRSWQQTPFADILYACDGAFWRCAAPEYGVDARAHFAGERWCQIRGEVAKDKEEAESFGLFYIRSVLGYGLSREANTIRRGGNSGHQAIELAYLFGAREIVLIGYDMQNTGGRAHFFGDHPKPLRQADNPSVWIPGFETLARDLAAEGVRVINATRETALKCFVRASLDDALTSIVTLDAA